MFKRIKKFCTPVATSQSRRNSSLSSQTLSSTSKIESVCVKDLNHVSPPLNEISHTSHSAISGLPPCALFDSSNLCAISTPPSCQILTLCEISGTPPCEISGPPPCEISGPPPCEISGPPSCEISSPPPCEISSPPPCEITSPPIFESSGHTLCKFPGPKPCSTEGILQIQVAVSNEDNPVQTSSTDRMDAGEVQRRITQLANEICLEIGRRKEMKKNSKADEKGKKDKKTDKTLKRLTYHERCNRNKQLFSEHIKEELKENSVMFSCKTCSAFPTTINKVLAERHARGHAAPKKRPRERNLVHDCAFCDEKFQTKKAHIVHYQNMHCEAGLKNITCTKCLKSFDRISQLKVHMKCVHLQDKAFQCDDCGQKFRDSFSLKAHEQCHILGTNLCSQCGKVFQNKKSLSRHVRCVHSNIRRHQCDICSKRFRDRFGLTRHVKEAHKQTTPENNTNINLEETDENKENEAPNKLNLNMKKCPICQKPVKRLHKHLKVNHSVDKFLNSVFNQNKYHCKKCGKPMRDYFNLERHEKTCGKEKNFDLKCDLCHKQFVSKQNLKRHVQRIHEIPHKCQKCQVIFSNKHQFFKHIPCHYSCECNQQFSNFYLLELHHKKCEAFSKSQYHNVISYKCVVCGVDGINAEELRPHMESHHGYVTRCELCLVDTGNLAEHIFEKHYCVRRMRKSYKKLGINEIHSNPLNPVPAPRHSSENTLKLASAPIPESSPIKKNLLTSACPENIFIQAAPAPSLSEKLLSPEVNLIVAVKSKPPQSPTVLMNSVLAALDVQNKSNVLSSIPITEASPIVAVKSKPAPSPTRYCGGEQFSDLEGTPPVDTPQVSDCESDTSTVMDMDDINLDDLLVCETEEQKRTREELDRMDKCIQDEKKTGEENVRKIDAEIEAIKEGMARREREGIRNKNWATILAGIEVEKIQNLAEKFLPKLEEDETSPVSSTRRKLYNGSSGEQQSLLYKQIWDPFTDDQHETVLKVLTEWHRLRGELNDHYIWNVTLPELLLFIYQEIFDLESVSHAELCILNTPVSEE